ncbi:MAG TPA: ATP-binding cassette domain-containing protein [Roseiflexaceae bacterium]|nr:ATP-binding cassette domain-containing protein [Roseiflexaceae bacterium]
MYAPDHNATATSDTVVELNGVYKTFYQKQRSARLRDTLRNMFKPPIREVQALRGIDLTIGRGQIVAYAGPNGAGKSTTVKMLSGMLAPDQGRVRSLGMDPVRERVRYVRRIGVVFGQRTELWNDHPIAASFEWKRVVWDIPRDRFEYMQALLKDVLGLHDYFHSLTRELSLGQKMRAELALALLHEPEILFLDEPTIGLDVLAKRMILDFIKQLNRTRHVTVMITSHDMSELEQLAGRIVMISQGAIAFDGSFDRLRREVSDRRRLVLQTGSDSAPALDGAELLTSEASRHEYVFDAARTRIADLLVQAGTQTSVLDVETHRAPIDEVIAHMYHRWRSQGQA